MGESSRAESCGRDRPRPCDRIWIDDRPEYQVTADCLAWAGLWLFTDDQEIGPVRIAGQVLDDAAVGKVLDANYLTESAEVTFNDQAWTCESGRWQPQPDG